MRRRDESTRCGTSRVSPHDAANPGRPAGLSRSASAASRPHRERPGAARLIVAGPTEFVRSAYRSRHRWVLNALDKRLGTATVNRAGLPGLRGAADRTEAHLLSPARAAGICRDESTRCGALMFHPTTRRIPAARAGLSRSASVAQWATPRRPGAARVDRGRSHRIRPVRLSRAFRTQRWRDRSPDAPPSPCKPGLNVAFGRLLIAVDTKIRSPHTMALEWAAQRAATADPRGARS